MAFSAAIFLSDPDATDRLGHRLAEVLKPGDTVLLEGSIGAGKTQLARATILALMQTSGLPTTEVPSPTYTLVQTYDLAETALWHVDLYRLADPGEVPELGLDEAIGRDIVLIEWPDRLDGTPDGALTVKLAVEKDGRRATLTSHSDRWLVLDPAGEPSDA